MGLYYITGVPGVGKSTVLSELRTRGFIAHEVDEIAAFYNTVNGQKTTTGQPAAERTIEWRKHHEWKIPSEEIEVLAKEAVHQSVFLCGVAANDTNFWDKFTEVFYLYAPPVEIERRLITMLDKNAYGKNSHELAETLKWAATARQQYTDLGATIIDATQPLSKIVDEILAYVDNGR